MKFIIILSVIISSMTMKAKIGKLHKRDLLKDLNLPVGENNFSYTRLKKLYESKKYNEEDKEMIKHTYSGIIVTMEKLESLFTIINEYYKDSLTEHYNLYLIDSNNLLKKEPSVCDLLWKRYNFKRVVIIPSSAMEPIMSKYESCEIGSQELYKDIL